MNEETTNVEMMDDDDLFFDPDDFADELETGDHTEDGDFAEETETESATEVTEDADAEPHNDTENTDGTDKPAELFDLKFLGETKQYTREEMTALAQKGLNHDRILQQKDELQTFRTQNEPLVSELGRIAQLFGMDNPADLLHAMEKNARRQRGESDAEAEANIRAEKADRQLKAAQSKEQKERQQQEDAQQRQQRDIQAFVQKYPKMDYNTIPEAVWDAVRGGETLVDAYGRYEMEQLRAENQRLQQQLAAQRQNEENRQKSLGSMRSGSQTPKLDDFLRGFNDD